MDPFGWAGAEFRNIRITFAQLWAYLHERDANFIRRESRTADDPGVVWIEIIQDQPNLPFIGHVLFRDPPAYNPAVYVTAAKLAEVSTSFGIPPDELLHRFGKS